MIKKCYLVYRRDYFIGDPLNGINVGQYIVSEREYYNDQMFERVTDTYKDFLSRDARVVLTEDEFQAYRQCVENNCVIAIEIKQKLEQQMLYNIYNKSEEFDD